MSENLLTKMNELYPTMSKGQKKIANFITQNYDKAVFMTAAKMGKTVGVSESTVVRFATLLGYDGYPRFQSELEEVVKGKLHSIHTIEINSSISSKSDVLESVMLSDAEKIKFTMNMIDKEAFDLAVDMISKARKIYIVGIRSCAPLAEFLRFYLSMIFDDVILLTTNSSSELFEQMLRINDKDCIIGISFPRYSMRTLKAMEFANNRNAKVITITDSVNSPMTLYSSCNLIARSDMTSIVDSLVAPLSVINALVVSLCIKKSDKVANNLKTLEEVWDEYQVYSGDEINVVDDSIRVNNKMENDDNE